MFGLSYIESGHFKLSHGDFSGGPVAKIMHSQHRELKVWSLVRELDPTCCNLDPDQLNKHLKKKNCPMMPC